MGKKEGEQKETSTRRDFLKKSATVAGVAAASAFLGGQAPLFVKNARAASTPLRILGLPIGPVPAIMEKAMEDLGFEVVAQTSSDQGVVLKMNTAPEEYDLVENYTNYLTRAWPTGNLQPVDTQRIDAWEEMPPFLRTTGHVVLNDLCDKNGILGLGEAPRLMLYVDDNGEIMKDPTKTSRYVTLSPNYGGADSLGYVATEMAPVKSWAELFDDRFHGRAALQLTPANCLMDVGLALTAMGQKFENLGDINKKEIDIIVDYIIEKKKTGHIRAFWETFDQAVSLVTSGEVVIQPMWGLAVNAARGAGIDCRWADIYSEGYRGFMGGFSISKHCQGETLERCYKYINWANTGFYGAALSRMGFYMPLQSTYKALTPEEYDYWYRGRPARVDIKDFWGGSVARKGDVRFGGSFAQRMGRVAVWNHFPKEAAYVAKRWTEMIAS